MTTTSKITVRKWRVVVTATQQFDYVWKDENEGEPTVSSTGQPIDIGKSKVVREILGNQVKIQEEAISTGGHFYVSQNKYTCPGNQMTEHVITFPVDINMISTTVVTTNEMFGDFMKWEVSPNTTIGATIDSVPSGSTSAISVNSTVTDNIKIGFEVRLATNPTGPTEDLGFVTSIDKDAQEITTTQSPTQNFATGSLVQMTVPFMEGELGYPDHYEYGNDKIGTSYLPANTPVYMRYTNNSVNSKDIYIQFQYLY